MQSDALSSKPKITTKQMSFCAIFIAMTAICSQIQIPLPIIPINLALLAVYLAGAMLGARYGAFSIAAYVLLGALGAPVFVNFAGGFGILFGKTGGYIIGYILAAFAIGWLTERWNRLSFFKYCFAMTIGLLLCYLFGTIWFMQITHFNLLASLTYCVFPFLPGDAIKIALAAYLANKLSPVIQR